MSSTLARRGPFLAFFLICAAMLGYGYYLQFVEYLDPCPLCIFQRVAYMAIGALGLLGALHGPQRVGTRVYAALIGLAGLIGAGIAGRQVWLQHLPADQVPECGPGLEFMLQAYPLNEVLREAFTGSGECANVDWRFLGLSIAEWSLIWFVLFIAAALVIFVRARQRAR